MRVTHPAADRGAAPAAAACPDGETRPLTDGAVDCPAAVAEELAVRWAERYGTDAGALLATEGDDPDAETCPVEKTDGEVCGRERPCRYHDE